MPSTFHDCCSADRTERSSHTIVLTPSRAWSTRTTSPVPSSASNFVIMRPPFAQKRVRFTSWMRTLGRSSFATAGEFSEMTDREMGIDSYVAKERMEGRVS